MFTIDKNIPMPEHIKKRTSERTVFLRTLQVGDSFECTRKEYRIVSSYAKRMNIKLSSRHSEYGNISYKYNGYESDIVRVWRIE